MKGGTCKTCARFKGNGKSCTKSGGMPNYEGDSCGAYKFKKADYISDRYFQEQRIARANNMFRRMA